MFLSIIPQSALRKPGAHTKRRSGGCCGAGGGLGTAQSVQIPPNRATRVLNIWHVRTFQGPSSDHKHDCLNFGCPVN